MKKNILIFLIIIIALAAVFVIYVSISTKNNLPIEEQVQNVPVPVESDPSNVKTESIKEKYYTMDLSYPHPDQGYKEVNEYVEKVKKDFLDLAPKDESEALEKNVSTDRAYAFKLITDTYHSSTTVTYKIETYMFTGGAHGGTYIATFTYDKDKKYISIENILVNDDSLKRLSEEARDYFYEKLKGTSEKNVIDYGTTADIENFSNFYVTDENMTFIFQQYQIGPYALGIQEFPLSRQAARDILSI